MPVTPPIEAEKLIPHRPPMLLVRRLLERDLQEDTALAEAQAPVEGLFINGNRLIPEYYIELSAQAAGLANGYDRLRAGSAGLHGFLTGLGRLKWLQEAAPGSPLLIRLRKEFAFGNIKMIAATVYDPQNLEIFQGVIKVWEDNA